MSRRSWRQPIEQSAGANETTRAHVIETIESESPETKAELADALGVSEHAVSRLLSDLKREGIVSKGYVVDPEAVYESAESVSELHVEEDSGRRSSLLTGFRRLDEVTFDQYEAARDRFVGESPERSPTELESLANERCVAVLHDLKSYTLTTDWPANRIAADLATVATNLELIGDYACFIHDAVDDDSTAMGTVGEKVTTVFEGGARIHEHFRAILFEGEAARFDRLQEEEGDVHRHLDELFELVTACDDATFGRLVTVTRALERGIYYWVNASELIIQVMTGVEPDHLDI
jgi:DNA-binding Lrp family transcriptional regulator